MTEAVVPRFGPKDVGKEFELNLEDENGPTIKKATDLIENKYPVIRQLPESGA